MALAQTQTPESAREPWRKWYYRKEWKHLRAVQLANQPLCAMCDRQGKVEPASVVDHITPHRGDRTLFFDPDNLQSLCKSHHDAGKQKEERAGYSAEPDDDGWPMDPQHPGNRGNG